MNLCFLVKFLVYFWMTLTIFTYALMNYDHYTEIIGYISIGIEATLGIP